MTGDDRWYEAAFVVGITNALNVVADGLGGAPMPQVEPETAPAEVRTIFADIRAFYGTGGPAADVLGGEIPVPFGLIAHEDVGRSEEHTSELQSRQYLVFRLLLATN